MRQTTRITWLATGLAVALGLAPAYAQKKDEKAGPPADPKQVLISAIVGATNEAMKGEAGTTVFNADPATRSVAADPATKVEMTLGIDYLKASDNKIYAPFTVTIQPDVIGKGANFGAYIRLAPKGAQPPAAPPVLDEKARKEKEKQDKKNKKKGKEAQDLAGQSVSGVEYPWEDYYDLTATPRGPGGPLTFSRPFSVAAGEYDAYVAVTVKDPAAAAGPLKVAVHKATITVPNYWADTFQISSVFVANKVTPLAEVPTGEAQKLKPYVIGNLEVSPTVDGKFTKADELSVFFIIYGVALGDDKKPDVTIEWQPYKKGPLGEAKFRGVAPQKLNSETLPPGFDVAQGHQLVGSLNVPVEVFEPGDYRLAIKVTDNKTGKSLTHDVAFTVAGS
ncbi:hypothetical protein TBR22_A05050 [Luteitalea sp. TBR-22]|uniref:hypothetical protein n=1 Tax=Luteitalea sp. TBR-22 TaxID=2802971 RepID=UPI001AF0F433|nr:hypothetical protein [Luteitalea sp. TBR-22]BCS31305.1 hypothetical protein TBR22_A05050 [Luteitalea sp. TBR-22]